MKIFLACPVRGISDEYREGIEAQVKHLEEQGHKVHYPPRDTNQDDPTGIKICAENQAAINSADCIYVIWDGKSQGVLFDLGMAFVMNKPLRTIVGYMPAMTNGKSFQNMMFAWEDII
jgi:nucleoside 2-deoxyribosyltransferase